MPAFAARQSANEFDKMLTEFRDEIEKLHRPHPHPPSQPGRTRRALASSQKLQNEPNLTDRNDGLLIQRGRPGCTRSLSRRFAYACLDRIERRHHRLYYLSRIP